ncbi:SMI1/KNR4 family protein [Oscillospiraceae bacterium WX1]
MMNEEWRDRIVAMVYVKQELMKLDVDGIWPHHLPELAASEETLRKTEAHLGFRIDQDYREFLKMADGWKGYLQTVDLFGTEELSGSPTMQYAQSLLDFVEDGVIQSTGFSREELLPIAATKYDKDLFVMTRPTSHAPGTVIWFAGEEIDRYPNFTEYFLAMIEYNRQLVNDMQKGN